MPERAAKFFGQWRLAEQAGVFEPGEVGESRRHAKPHSPRKAGVVNFPGSAGFQRPLFARTRPITSRIFMFK
jgi:hypothetical protein